MSKFTARKSLALGAIVALGSSALVGLPAQAAASLTIAPNAGSTYTVLSSNAFVLKAFGNVDLPDSQFSKLRWEVTNSTGTALTYAVSAGTASVDGTAGTASSGTSDVVGSSAWTTNGSALNTLSINPTTDATTSALTVAVRAFIDVDLSGSVTDGDVVSGSQTINYISGSSLSPVVTLADPVVGAKPSATVTFGNLNLEQTTLADMAVDFIANGSTAGAAQTGALNSAKTAVVYTGANNVNASETIGARLRAKKHDGDSSITAEFAYTYKSASAAGTATQATATLANGANIRTATNNDAIFGTTATGTSASFAKVVRSGTKTVEFTVQFKTNSTTNSPAGQPVKVTVAEIGNTSLVSTEEITAGGETLKQASTSAKDSIVYYTTTGTDGKVTVSLAAKNGTAGSQVEVIVASGASYTGAVVGGVLEWKAASVDRVVETTQPLGDSTRRILKGGTTTLSYVVVDQWGQPYAAADTDYRLVITPSTQATFTYTATVTSGRASQVVVDNSVANGSYNVTAALESKATTGSSWSAVTASNIYTAAPAGNATAVTAFTTVAALDVASSIVKDTVTLASGGALASSGIIPLSDKALDAADNRVDANTYTAFAATNTTGANVSGVVRTATGANAAGIAVTLSSPGLLFDAGAVTALGSITVITGSDGAYSVDVYSTSSGAKTVAISAGSATASESLTFALAAEADADAVVITAVDSTPAGRTIDVTIKVVDENGNGIDTDASGDVMTITSSGAGYFANIPSSPQTGADGTLVLKYVVLSGETGTATITVSFDADGSGSTYAAVSATKTITVGAAASATQGTSVKRTGNTVAVRVTGYAKSRIVLNGVRVASRSTLGTLSRNLTLRAGRNVIQIVVDGTVIRTVRYTR